jgi:hypothetical protein
MARFSPPGPRFKVRHRFASLGLSRSRDAAGSRVCNGQRRRERENELVDRQQRRGHPTTAPPPRDLAWSELNVAKMPSHVARRAA